MVYVKNTNPLREGKLYLKTFSRGQLKREGLSVARERYTTREEFDKYLVTQRNDGLEWLSEKKRARVRDAIDADLATAFGDVFPIDQAFI